MADNGRLSIAELARTLTEIVRSEGGIIWRDKALTLLVRQEKVELSYARYALTQATSADRSLEYSFGNETWYPATLRLPGETRSKPEDPPHTAVSVPRDLLERCVHYAQGEKTNMIDAQRLKRILATRDSTPKEWQ